MQTNALFMFPNEGGMLWALVPSFIMWGEQLIVSCKFLLYIRKLKNI